VLRALPDPKVASARHETHRRILGSLGGLSGLRLLHHAVRVLPDAAHVLDFGDGAGGVLVGGLAEEALGYEELFLVLVEREGGGGRGREGQRERRKECPA